MSDTPTTGQAGPKRGILRRLYHGETEFAFVPRWRIWFGVSAAFILVGLAAFGVRGGLNLGIDFTGGNQWEVPAGDATVADVEDAVSELGFSEVEVQEVGDDLRIQTATIEGDDTERQERGAEVVDALVELTGAEANEVAINEVGPSWGEEISRKALQALVVFLIAIVIYITIRFEFRMAMATLGALVHDILVVIGAYALLQLPVTPATVVAILTILGFSIYDGIVVFDRVDENTRLLTANARMTYSDMVDRSLNEVLMRSLNTQITAILPILSVLVVGSLALGASTLQEFGLALFIGQLSGAYSSIFIASPLLALLKEREPRFRTLRQRLEGKGAKAATGPSTGTPAKVDDADGGVALAKEPAPTGAGSAPATGAAPRTKGAAPPRPKGTPPPRPRKKGKRR
ncbi:protein translocase subunit SecF [Iamia sp. SCSIO 61187]|uniref:protein translocase subunit SecF n=1 Tax=Iamia sp. SCSIO 61187 TaxID=2722752 RepID=UPI001C62AFAE|nr:protein translocase subunit SecF [Iamia sp. SCSIO 61187]QYG93392.1 protein translocase subunit SecF [Iamia sp. SCSIO 61187]